MKLEKWKEKTKKKMGIMIGICSVISLCAVIIVVRSFALYEEQKEFDVIKGQVPDQNYDVMFSFILEDENNNQTIIENIPEGKDYDVTISCNNNANGIWDYEAWGPLIKNLTNTRTKCKISFGPVRPSVIETIKNIPIVTNGSGLYEVSHSDANITYTTEQATINNLKQTELRYAGSNPNNYIKFNNELWRVIGLVNTKEGQRVKIIRNESIGEYSYDTSENSINNGYGINEWSTSKIQELLNHGAYYNRSSGTCYHGSNNVTKECDFKNNGLTNEAKNLIDRVTWNYGSYDGKIYVYNNINTKDFYNLERSNNTGKICSSGTYCNDSVERTTSWVGEVGLLLPSDYGYATSGGSQTDRATCLNKELLIWNRDEINECKQNDWLFKEIYQWTMIPTASSGNSNGMFVVDASGRVGDVIAGNTHTSLFPVIYLKTNVKIRSGNGTINSPYEFTK